VRRNANKKLHRNDTDNAPVCKVLPNNLRQPPPAPRAQTLLAQSLSNKDEKKTRRRRRNSQKKNTRRRNRYAQCSLLAVACTQAVALLAPKTTSSG
jgi:hypothetical protein